MDQLAGASLFELEKTQIFNVSLIIDIMLLVNS